MSVSRMRVPPGLIVVACGDIMRYTNFTASMARTVSKLDDESAVLWSIGATVADNLNDGVRALLAEGNEAADWLWCIGDDHEWDWELVPALVQRMYMNDLDILVPLCYRRSWPPGFVIYDTEDEEGVVWPTNADAVADVLRSGDYTREVKAAGNAGMLIRRRVLVDAKQPVFRNGLEGPGGERISEAGEDINFCEDAKARGFKIHAAYDLPLGHITSVTLAPEMVEDVFGLRMFFGAKPGPFVRLTEARSGEGTEETEKAAAGE